MRIVHVTDCYLPRLGGIELQVHDLATRQAAAGHEVTVLTTTAAAGSDLSPAGPQVGPAPLEVQVVSSARPRHPAEKIMYRSTRAGVRSLTGRLGGYDLVHVHASSFSPLSFLAAHHASLRGVPTVATVHSLWAKATWSFRAADHISGWGDWPVVWSAVSNAAAASLRAILAGRAPVTILANGIDPEEWEGAQDRSGPDPDRGPRPGILRVAAVSRLARRKRILPLMEILQAAHDRLPPETLMYVSILGEGPQRKDIERYLRRHDMEDWVQLLGRRSRAEIREVFARTDLFVAPATLESFGIAALEARCAGLPVLARTETGVEDFVADGVEGWLVRSDAAMVDTIASLARAPEVVARVAEHNRTVPACISWKAVLDECEELYEKAARRHGRRWLRAGSGAAGRAPALRGGATRRATSASGGAAGALRAGPHGPAPGR